MKKSKILEAKAIANLKALKGHDVESDHATADDILCDLLIAHGYFDLVYAYKELDKWYA